MRKPLEKDAYAATILARMDPQIRATLDEAQELAIAEALTARSGLHLIDLRRLLPLYFVSYYIVFQFGRDRRLGRRRVEYNRRLHAVLAGNVMFFIFAISPLIVFALIGLYFLKAALGIDLFSGFHLPSLFGFGRG